MPENETENRKTVCAILLAAGLSSRMGFNKLTIDFSGRTPIELSLAAFLDDCDEAVIACSPETLSAVHLALDRLEPELEQRNFPVRIVMGGARRQDSVYNALTATDADIASIHDCARCLITKEIVHESISSAIEHGSGVASIRPVDTLRSEADGMIVDRDRLLAAQTPQSFDRAMLLDAYSLLDATGEIVYTDDAAIFRAAGNTLCYSKGSRFNIKLTTPDDLPVFRALLELRKEETKMKTVIRTGFGEDTHRLVEERALILGGVEVPFEKGLLGHSDADVLTHAIIDAVLGACAMGDIGQHFPDSDPAYKGISSLALARTVSERIKAAGFELVAVDSTVVAQRPKLGGYRDAMRQNIAGVFGVDMDSVSIKFTTPEHTGPEGRGESMTARAVATVEKIRW